MSEGISPSFYECKDGTKLAYHYHQGSSGLPTVIFLGGLMADMKGSKATSLEAFARERGQNYLRFDYSGHGQSGREFKEGTIGRWTEDALTLIDSLTLGPLILVGSSMGGWIAINVALKRPQRLHALVGIAAAPDFTQELMWNAFSNEIKDQILTKGVHYASSDYGDPYPITLQLIEEGRLHLCLNHKLDVDVPVRLLHGMADTTVPWEYAPRLAKALRHEDVTITLIKDGDHSLSRDEDLKALKDIVRGL